MCVSRGSHEFASFFWGEVLVLRVVLACVFFSLKGRRFFRVVDDFEVVCEHLLNVGEPAV